MGAGTGQQFIDGLRANPLECGSSGAARTMGHPRRMPDSFLPRPSSVRER